MNRYGTEKIRQWRIERPTLLASDEPGRLVWYLLAEILEARAAFEVVEKAEQDFNVDVLRELHLELADMLVFLNAIFLRERVQISSQDIANEVNGQGARSDIFDQLLIAAYTMYEGDVQKNLSHFLVLITSLLHHAPGGAVQFEQIIPAVLEKISDNRPEQFYGRFDTNGLRLNRDEMQQKYLHTEAMLRILRNHFQARLAPWMYEPYKALILEFRDSQKHQLQLKQDLEERRIQLKATMQRHLVAANAPLNKGFQQMLVTAGAVPI